MTFITIVMLGAGALLVSSALDGTPIVETLQKIIQGKPLSVGTTAATSTAQTVPIPNAPAGTGLPPGTQIVTL